MTSVALSDLSGRVAEVQLVAAADPLRLSNEYSTTANRLSSGLCRSAVVLLSAHLEGYLEDLATEALDSLVTHRAVLDRVPLLLRALHAEEHIRTIDPVVDRNARAPKIRDMFQSESHMWLPGAAVIQGTMRAKTVCAEMNNPGSREIQQFLRLFGVDLKRYLRAVGEFDALARIDGLVAVRNAVAHGEHSATATWRDVDDYVDAVLRLATYIDQAMAEQLQDICSSTTLPW